MAARFIRPRWVGPCRGSGQSPASPDGPVGAGRSTRDSLRGRARGALLPFDADSNAVLRHLLCVGAVVAAGQEQRRPVVRGRLQSGAVQLVRGGLAPARAGAASLVPAVVRPGPVEAARPRRSAGLDGGGTRPRGPGRVLLAVQRGRGGAVLLPSRSSKLSTPHCARNWASGTRQRKWSATWWPAWTGR